MIKEILSLLKKYKIPIKVVIQPKGKKLDADSMQEAFTAEGVLVNSGKFNRLKSEEARRKITESLESKGLGNKAIQYKLRDWLISRQRYWGTPIPIIYCDDCGIVPVPEKDLPVELPEKVQFGKGNPLETNKSFVQTSCPRCSKSARRETDTMDTFFDSSWYFLRYTDSGNDKKPFDPKKAAYWMPVDQYVGGAEHAVMHLLYARFFTKVLRDLGFVHFDEPFPKLFNQGMLHKDGFVMSKSRGNVVLPEEVSKKYNIDTARLFLVSIASPDKDTEWSDKGVEGIFKFITKIVDYFGTVKIGKSSERVAHKVNKSIKEIGEDIDNFRYNVAVIRLRKLFASFGKEISKKDLESFVKLLSPFCPHLAEEFWEVLGNKPYASLQPWPRYDATKIKPELDIAEEYINDIQVDIRQVLKLAKIEKPTQIFLFIAPVWKYTLYDKTIGLLEKTRDAKQIIQELMKTPLKEHGKIVIKLVPALIKKLPDSVPKREQEIKYLQEAVDDIKKEFACEIVIQAAEESKEAKASQALPGKPAIFIE